MAGGIGGQGGFDPVQMAQAMFKKLDANADNSIDLSELQAAAKGRKGPSPEQILKTADTDGDSKISGTEFQQILKKTGGPGGTGPKGGMPPGGGIGGPRGAGGGRGPKASENEESSDDTKIYDKMDANKDGIVTYEERIAYEMDHPQAKGSGSPGNPLEQQVNAAYGRQEKTDNTFGVAFQKQVNILA